MEAARGRLKPVRSILLVCTANICRSPTAAGVLKKTLEQAGLAAEVGVASAGTHDYQAGMPASPPAVALAKLRGYEIAGHSARRVQPGDFDRHEMILAMDRANLEHLRAMAPTRSRSKIELLLDYSERYPGQEVPDPYGGTDREYLRAFEMIEDGCRGLVARLARDRPAP